MKGRRTMNFGVIIGILVTLIGVVMVYDARLLTKRLFSFGDQNEASMGLKIFGFILAIIGGLIIYLNMK